MRRRWEQLKRWVGTGRKLAWIYLKLFYHSNEGAVHMGLFALISYVVKATGALVESGNRGLLFSFGRARVVLEPGFRILLPFLQVVRMMPVRSRTLNLNTQQVTTLDGLVYDVDTTLVYRVDDLKKALIEIDDLLKGLYQTIGLAVQELLCTRDRAALKVSDDLNARLEQRMAPALSAWGVVVERVGFNSITPSPVTVRLTQLTQRVQQRRDCLRRLERAGVPTRLALSLLGAAPFPRRRYLEAIARERTQRRRSRLRRRAIHRARIHPGLSAAEASELIEAVLEDRPVRPPTA